MSDLNDYVTRNKKFLKLSDGESATVVYLGHKVAVNEKEPDKEIVLYQVKYPNAEKTMVWKSASIVVAETMSNISKGETIKITRHGLLTETKYDIEPVK